MHRLDPTDIVRLLRLIAANDSVHPYELARQAVATARGLSNNAPHGDGHSAFHAAAETFVLACAANNAYSRACLLLDHGRILPAYNTLEKARGAISGLDGAEHKAQLALCSAWCRLFAPAQPETITLVRSKADYCAACDTIHPDADRCPLTGDEYGTPA